MQETRKNGTVVVSALSAHTRFGKLLRGWRMSTTRSSSRSVALLKPYSSTSAITCALRPPSPKCSRSSARNHVATARIGSPLVRSTGN